MFKVRTDVLIGTETYSESLQTSKMVRFAKIVNGYY